MTPEELQVLEKRVARLESRSVDEALLKQREEALTAANKAADDYCVKYMELQRAVFKYLNHKQETDPQAMTTEPELLRLHHEASNR